MFLLQSSDHFSAYSCGNGRIPICIIEAGHNSNPDLGQTMHRKLGHKIATYSKHRIRDRTTLGQPPRSALMIWHHHSPFTLLLITLQTKSLHSPFTIPTFSPPSINTQYSLKYAIVSTNPSKLAEYGAISVPPSVIIFVVPTVLYPYTAILAAEYVSTEKIFA